MKYEKIYMNGELVLDLSNVDITPEDVAEGKGFINKNSVPGQVHYGTLHQYLPEYQKVMQGIDAEGCLTIPAGPEAIGDYLFYNNTKIEKIKFVGDFTKNNHTIKTIGKEAFKNTKITELTLPETVINIDNSAFENCPIDTLILPKNLKTIGQNAFASVPLTNHEIFYFPESLETIGNWAFCDSCIGPKISFPSTLQTIESYAFLQCTSIEEIFIGKPVEDILTGTTNTTLLRFNPVDPTTEGMSGDFTFMSQINYSEVCIDENGEQVTVYVTGNTNGAEIHPLVRQLKIVFIPITEKLDLGLTPLVSSALPTDFNIIINNIEYTKENFKYYDFNFDINIYCYGREMSIGNTKIKPWYPNSIKEKGIYVDELGNQYIYVAALWPTQGMRDEVYIDYNYRLNPYYYDGEKTLTINSDAFYACSGLHKVTLQGIKELQSAFYASHPISIFLRDLVPPEQEAYPFNIYSEITLYVPKPSLQLYKNKWPDIANYIHSF